jgi:c-di-GMP-binding flagellar brake protein YcgR
MDYKEWMYILLVVVFLLILSLYFLLRKSSHKPHLEMEITTTQEKKESPTYASFTGINLRENFRVNLDDVPCFVEFLDVENESLTPKYFNGVLKNISVGGVKVVGEFEYPIVDEIIIKVRFSLKDSMFILKGRIVRKELYPERDKFGYGVQFTNLFDEDRELLYQILNRIMAERRKKRVKVGLLGEESMV